MDNYCQAQAQVPGQVQVQVPGQVQKVPGPVTKTWTWANIKFGLPLTTHPPTTKLFLAG